MTESEKREILDALEASRNTFRGALAGIGEDLAARKPSDGGWSILECAEHVAVVERFLLSRLAGASRSEVLQGNRTREARIAAGARDRSVRRESPAEARPANRFATLAEALAAFESARDETVRFVEGFNGDFRCWTASHPLIPGPVSCYELLIMMTAHPERHAQQIAGIEQGR